MSVSKQFDKAQKRAAAINKPDMHGINKLFDAIDIGDYHNIAKLLKEGADVRCTSKKRGLTSQVMFDINYAVGSTPLHAACLKGNFDIAVLLLQYGADPNAKNYEGLTPLDYALNSLSYYQEAAQKKTTSRFSTRNGLRKTLDKIRDYEATIRHLIDRGGTTGVFALPEKFKTKKQEPGASGPA